MSTVSTPYGVGATQVYDFAYISNLDMEPYLPRYSPMVGGTYAAGINGYVLLNISSVSWTTTLASFDSTDNIFINLDVAGFDPEYMSPPVDGSGVSLQHYRIASPTGTISFVAGTNPAKYVWPVRNGQIQGVALNDDLTFTAARLVASIQQNNTIPASQPVVFTVTYTLSFVSLDTAISGAITTTVANLSVDPAKPTYVKVLSNAAFTSVQSGYILLVLGQITSTSTLPVRTNDFVPRVNDDSPMFYATLHDGTTLHSQYAARHSRTKVFNVTPRFVIFPVNQGKVGVQGELVDTTFNLAKLKLVRGNSDDNATVVLNYGISSATV